VSSGSCSTPVTISFSSFGGPAGPLIGIGSQISVTFTVTGTSQVPSVTLYNGATASTENMASPYTFSYTLKAGDNGPIVYIVQAKDQAWAVTTAVFVDSSRTAGKASSAVRVNFTTRLHQRHARNQYTVRCVTHA